MTEETTKQWWEECHKTRGNFFVSDYSGPSLWRSINIEDRVRQGVRVLEIGVGDGGNVRELRRMRCHVYALDIARNALDKVRGAIMKGWRSPENLPDRYFDLVISHLVTQHIDNAALERQIRNVLRSLRKDGIFAMQFADHHAEVTGETYNESLRNQQVGGVCRSLGMVRSLVNDCGGALSWVSDPLDFPQYDSRWFYVHISRPQEP